MKKTYRLYVTGSTQPMFFNQFIKSNADKLGVKGFIRGLEDGRIEIFIEGNIDQINQMIPICERGPPHTQVRKVEKKEERFQDFKEFRVLKI